MKNLVAVALLFVSVSVGCAQMSLDSLRRTHTPNQGREVTNANFLEIQDSINAFVVRLQSLADSIAYWDSLLQVAGEFDSTAAIGLYAAIAQVRQDLIDSTVQLRGADYWLAYDETIHQLGDSIRLKGISDSVALLYTNPPASGLQASGPQTVGYLVKFNGDGTVSAVPVSAGGIGLKFPSTYGSTYTASNGDTVNVTAVTDGDGGVTLQTNRPSRVEGYVRGFSIRGQFDGESASGTDYPINWKIYSGYWIELGGNITFRFDSLDAQSYQEMTIRVVNPGYYSVSWPNDVKWNTSSPPVQTVGGTDIYYFTAFGTTVYGSVKQGYEVAAPNITDSIPTTVTDLATLSYSARGAAFTFTAPYGRPGNVAYYDLRYATKPIGNNTVIGSGTTDISWDDSSSFAPVGDSTRFTWDHTNSGNYLIVSISYKYYGTVTTTSVTYNGDALTRLGSGINHNELVAEQWYLENPDVGTYPVQVTLSDSAWFAGGALSYDDVEGVGTYATNADGWGHPTINIGSATGEVVVAIAAAFDAFIIKDEASTGWWEHPVNAASSTGMTIAGATTVTLTGTISSPGQDWVFHALTLQKAAGDPGEDTLAFASCTQATGLATPNTAGTLDTLTVSGLVPNTTYWFAMKSIDGTSNVSLLSNVVTFTTTAVVAGIVDGVTTLASGYDVKKTGSDAADGKSYATAFRTLTKLSTVLGSEAGYDTALVAAGVYQEDLTFNYSGTVLNPLVVMRYGRDVVTVSGLDNEATTNGNRVIYMPHNYAKVYGINITNQDNAEMTNAARKWEYVIDISGSYCTVERCTVYSGYDPVNLYNTIGAWGRGISVAGTNNTIKDNYLSGWYMGVVISGTSPRNHLIMNNVINKNFASGIVVGGTDDGTTAYHNTVIAYCVIDTSVHEDGIQFDHATINGVNTQNPDGNRGTLVYGTRIGNCVENGIDFKGAGHTFIDSCWVYGSQGDDDGTMYGSPNDEGSGPGFARGNDEDGNRTMVVRRSAIWDNRGGVNIPWYGNAYILNNTILNNSRNYSGPNQSGIGWGIDGWPGSYGQTMIKNNIVVEPNYAYYEFLFNDAAVGLSINNNLYYGDTSATSQPYFHYRHRDGNNRIVSGIDAWKAVFTSSSTGYSYATGGESNSLARHPRFVSMPVRPSGWNGSFSFSLQDTSAARNAGTSYTQTTSSATSSTSLYVSDAKMFHAGFGQWTGDEIIIGTNAANRITSIDYVANRITLQTAQSWSSGAPVYLKYAGSAPDIGAVDR